jgi:pimeloyl-ACP methyl ester carboxylesterase
MGDVQQAAAGRIRPAYRSAQGERRFNAAYDAVLGRWPVAVDVRDLASAYGRTRVHACGPPRGVPLVLLHGAGATSTVWFSTVGGLAETLRVYAVDQIGDAGRSVHDGRPLRASGDLTSWLDTVLDGLQLERAHLAGHSYGGWLALTYGLRHPERVLTTTLIDPTNCFAGLRPSYLAHAAPTLVPTLSCTRRFLIWETRAAGLDRGWLDLAASAAGDVRRSRVVIARRPSDDALRGCRVPTRVLLGERSRAHDIRTVARRAARLLPDAEVAVLPGATHHSLPTEHGEVLAGELLCAVRCSRPAVEGCSRRCGSASASTI